MKKLQKLVKSATLESDLMTFKESIEVLTDNETKLDFELLENLRNKLKKISHNLLLNEENFYCESDIDFLYYLNDIDFDFEIDGYNELNDLIYDTLQEQGAFDIEIIYYYNAMEYLSENDGSLQESMGIAEEMGYDLGSINSELLASLLASQKASESFEFNFESTFEMIKETYDLIDSLEVDWWNWQIICKYL